MKKLLATFLSITLLSVIVYAHSGGTDASGGHYNRSTGEYHYHHGYSEHQHTDMDGDGVLDCPYNFDDQTDHRSGGSSGSSSYSIDLPDEEPEVIIETVTETVTVEVEKEVPFIPTWIYWVIGGLVLIILCMCSALKEKCEELNNNKSWHLKEIADEKERANKAIESEKARARNAIASEKERASKDIETQQIAHEEIIRFFKNDALAKQNQLCQDFADFEQDLIRAHGKNYLLVLAGAPEGDTVTEDGFPAHVDRSQCIWGEKYTFYIGSSAKRSEIKYHRSSCHHRGFREMNAYTIRNNTQYTPCKLCSPELPNLDWFIRYQNIKRFFAEFQKKNDL